MSSDAFHIKENPIVPIATLYSISSHLIGHLLDIMASQYHVIYFHGNMKIMDCISVHLYQNEIM